jgi:putative transposase
MPNYRRVRLPGAAIFITCVTFNRVPIFADRFTCQLLYQVWSVVTKRKPFTTVAFCLLPDHFHTLITLHENDVDYMIRVREIKRLFTRYYQASTGKTSQRNQSYVDKQEATIWQRRFWEHTIKNDRDFEHHFNYIHYNPVKHGLVTDVEKWEWSSFHRYVRLGIYAPDWGSELDFNDESYKFGE